jgi:hypothetical protein
MDKYSVFYLTKNLPPGYEKEFKFTDANDVAIFMWGRSAGKYLIYKNGNLAYLSHLYADVSKLEKYLDELK